jgi:anti-anti-sigma factor
MNQDQPSDIRIEPAHDHQLVHLQGELCLMNAEPVRQALAGTISTGSPPMVLNLAALTGIDLCGLQLLCSVQRTCQSNNLSFTLSAVPDWFREIVDTTGFQSHPAFRALRQERICD